MWIAPQDFLKRDLIHDPGKIKAARPVGKGNCAAALQVSGNIRNAAGIGNHALRYQNQIIINVVSFQRRQTARSAGHIGKRCAFGGNGNRRLFQYMNAILRTFFPVP